MLPPEFCERLLKQCRGGDEQQAAELQRALRRWRCTAAELDAVFDSVLDSSRMWPSVADVRTMLDAARRRVAAVPGPARHGVDVEWRTWRDAEGRPWAQRVRVVPAGTLRDESTGGEISFAEGGREAFISGYRAVTGTDPDMLRWQVALFTGKREQSGAWSCVSDYDDSDRAIGPEELDI